MAAFTTMTSKGQLPIPNDACEQLRLTPGTRFVVTARDAQVVAMPKYRRIADPAGSIGTPPASVIPSMERLA